MRRIALLICLLSAYSLAQGGAATGIPTITNTRGEPVPYATVAVCAGYPGAVPSTPCGTSTLATISTDLSLATSCTNSLTPPGPISGAGCSNPGKSDGLGNIIAFATPGLYWCQYSGGSIIQPLVTPCFFANGSGGGIPFACASAVNGSIVGMTSTTTSSCDPNGITDFIGHWTSQSYRATGTFNGAVELTGGLADPTNAPDTNSVAFLAPLTVPTPFYLRPPSSVGAVGQCLGLLSQNIGTNGTIDALQWQSCAASALTLQTNTVDNSSQTLLNLVAGSNITLSNTSGGNVLITGSAGGLPTTQMANPLAPTLSTNGSAGSTSYTYLVVGCEDPACTYHTTKSSTTTIATGNATLTNSNSINLSGYGDTLYGARGFIVCRTASGGSPSSTGVITSGLIVGKKFIDTGLVGDGTNCATTYASNTSILEIDMNSNPGCNTPLGGHLLIDSPPCTPNAVNDEMRQTFGAPGDVNNPFWTWVNQGSATAIWSGGTIFLKSDTTASSNLEMLAQSTALPATPYTYIAYLDSLAPTAAGGCALGLRESSTGKLVTGSVFNDMTIDSPTTTAGGTVIGALSWTSPTVNASIHVYFYRPDAGIYFKIQNDGTNINVSWSPSGDGVNYSPLGSKTVASAFTTAPNQLILAVNSATTAAACTFDYVRRTQ